MILSRLLLRHAALRLAAHGWPVTPGACLRGGRFDCGRPGCPTNGCHPALADWEPAASHDAARIARWWRYAPHGVLLPTGTAFDVLEVSPPLAGRGAATLRSEAAVRGPAATIPTGRWMFFTQPGEPLLPELAGRLDVVRHTRGSWVPAPPTRLVDGPVRWEIPPAAVGWRLPSGYEVQRVLATVADRMASNPIARVR